MHICHLYGEEHVQLYHTSVWTLRISNDCNNHCIVKIWQFFSQSHADVGKWSSRRSSALSTLRLSGGSSSTGVTIKSRVAVAGGTLVR